MYKVAVIGDRDSVYGFASLGLDVFFAGDATEANVQIKKLANGEYAVIYVTEMIAELISEQIEKLSFDPSPAIILIPGIKGNTGKGMDSVRESVEKAVGSDILSEV